MSYFASSSSYSDTFLVSAFTISQKLFILVFLGQENWLIDWLIDWLESRRKRPSTRHHYGGRKVTQGGVGTLTNLGLITSSRTTILRFTSHETNVHVFTFHENRGRAKCQKRSSLNVSPILQIRVLRFYFSKLTRVSWTFWKTRIHAAINSLGKPAIGGPERTEVWSYIKRLESEVKSNHQMLVKVIWPN